MFCCFLVDLRLIMRSSTRTVSALFMQGSARHTPTDTHSITCKHTCAAGAVAALKRSLVSPCYANASKRLSENYI